MQEEDPLNTYSIAVFFNNQPYKLDWPHVIALKFYHSYLHVCTKITWVFMELMSTTINIHKS